ncbi:MAG: hypothetical protein M3680_10750 [Myxococcota bacterium]|nr:hypothetical protein [Myxococcota bacterium]
MADDDEAPAEDRAPTAPPRPDRERERYRDVRGDRDPHAHPHDGDTLSETIRQKLEQLVPDLVKKTFAAGMGAVFTTEEGIRRVVGGARESLPEVAGYIASSADGAKDKVFEVIARETREFLSNLNLTEEVAKLLTTLSFEIKTEIRFIPNSERMVGAEPDVKASVRLKRNDRDGKEIVKDAPHAPHASGRDASGRDDEVTGRDSRSRLRFWRRDEAGGAPGGSDDDGDDNPDK